MERNGLDWRPIFRYWTGEGNTTYRILIDLMCSNIMYNPSQFSRNYLPTYLLLVPSAGQVTDGHGVIEQVHRTGFPYANRGRSAATNEGSVTTT